MSYLGLQEPDRIERSGFGAGGGWHGRLCRGPQGYAGYAAEAHDAFAWICGRVWSAAFIGIHCKASQAIPVAQFRWVGEKVNRVRDRQAARAGPPGYAAGGEREILIRGTGESSVILL
jgi:hypothetical protein